MTEIAFITKFSGAAEIEAVVSVSSAHEFQVAPGTEEGVDGCSIIFNDQVASVPHMSVEEVKQAIAEAKADNANHSLNNAPKDLASIQLCRAQAPQKHGLRIVK